jgi:hypothetical protein
VIGDPEFVKEKLAHDRRRRLELSRYAREGWSLETVANYVVSQMGVEKECLYRRSRGKGSVCRKVFAYLAHRVFEIPVIDVARFLNVGGSAVSMMLEEGQRIAYDHGITQFD